MSTHRQPYVHDLITTVRAPAAVLSARSGQIDATGAQGLFVADRRALAQVLVHVNGIAPEAVQVEHAGGSRATFLHVVPGVGDPGPDPTVVLRRIRTTTADGMTEVFRLESMASAAVAVELSLRLASDLAPMEQVKVGLATSLSPPTVTDGAICWGDDDYRVTVVADSGAAPELDGNQAVVSWTLQVGPRSSTEVVIQVNVVDRDRGHAAFSAPTVDPWIDVQVQADDHRIVRLVDTGLRDLKALTLQDQDDHFLAAGSPWFLTLFGRDSIWAARMLLPLGTELALGTLNTLARRQGRANDPHTEEQPGKILHEVRREPLTVGGLSLPPVYFGTVDATPLWILLLGEAWRWGGPTEKVEALIPCLEAALRWLRDYGDSDGDGFLEYIDHTGHGLGNQGWKDSDDSVQWADGTLAESPVALCEVQGYAYAAALVGADLLDAFGRPGADEWRQWAAELGGRFREQFWTDDGRGPYVGIALDRDKRLVNTVASNMSHLLGTGILSPSESAAIAARLALPDMDSGHGLRTMTSASPRYSPLSYHGGSVWPHDTSIAASGLAAEGHPDAAGSLIQGMLASAADFDYRFPELYAGYPASAGTTAPYPAACRPQAWAAATGVAILTTLLGLEPNIPEGFVRIRPLPASPVGALTVRGVRLGTGTCDVSISREGVVDVTGLPAGLRLLVD